MGTPPELIAEDIATGVKLSLVLDGAEIAWLEIIRFRMRVGRAIVIVDGISGVWTEEAHREQGHARRLMEAAVRRMRAGDAALSVLYGIHDFYHRFGFAPAGPDQLIVLDELARSAPLPAGWRVRRALPADLPAIQAVYEQNSAAISGAVVREPPGPSWAGQAWATLAAALARPDAEECRVVETPGGQVAAACWRGTDVWFVSLSEEWVGSTMAFAEVLAASAPAAEAALSACRAWALEEGARRGGPLDSVTLAAPHAGLIGRAAALQDARLVLHYSRAGGFMARTLDPARLLAQLLPEIAERQGAAGLAGEVLRITGAEGDVTLRLGPGAPALGVAGDAPTLSVAMPQELLAQLVLGALPPDQLLEWLDPPPGPRAAELLAALFPLRRALIFPPDRP